MEKLMDKHLLLAIILFMMLVASLMTLDL